MNLRDARIGWRLLVKDPFYSAVTVLGLAIGFATCFLLLGYVRDSLTYDSQIPHAERIYQLKNRLNIITEPGWFDASPLPYVEVARHSALVEKVSVMHPLPVTAKAGARMDKNVRMYAVHPEFASIMGLRALEGDLAAALTRPDTLALTVSQAQMLFGEAHVAGKRLTIGDNAFTVAAVLADPPSNSTIAYTALTGMANKAWYAPERENRLHSWGMLGGRIFVTLKPGVAPQALVKVLQDAADRSPLRSQLPPELLSNLGGKRLMEMGLTALPDVYLDRDMGQAPYREAAHGDSKVVWGVAGVGALILLLAVTNYVNLATVHALRRQREIAMRKMLGASVGRLVGQFLLESLLVTLIATALGLLLAALLKPAFAGLMDSPLDRLFGLVNVAAALLIGALVGLLAGAYPTLVALRVRPQQTLSGRGSTETLGALRLRRALTVLQFATAMGLCSVTLAISWQTRFASHADAGFDSAPLLVVEMPFWMPDQMRGMRAELARLPGAGGVALSEDVVGRGVGNRDIVLGPNRLPITMGKAAVSSNFFEIYRVRPLAGRLFEGAIDGEKSDGVVVLNQAAVRTLGFASAQAAVGQLVTVGGGAEAKPMRVIGVAPDLRFDSLRKPPLPLAYRVGAELQVATVRLASGDIGDLERRVDALQRKYFPDQLVAVRHFASYFADNYAEDLRYAKLLALASLIALAIAAFGVYAMSAYAVQRLTKQIVLRKLYGAGRGAIARLMGREFIVLLGAGALLGLPLAAIGILRYLAAFVERAPIGVWTLVAALLIALVVTLLSTWRHARIAMTMSPALALRD